MAREPRIPLPALERLATYVRSLIDLQQAGEETVSSRQMEELTGVTAAQFRKDLSYFGEFGRRGVGYNVRDLHSRLAELLHIEAEQSVLMVGAGNLGSALIAYPGWNAYRFRIAAVFDIDAAKIGKEVRGLPIHDFARLGELNAKIGAEIGILAVPGRAAQEVADALLAAGVTGLLNFAPVKLDVPAHVRVREISFLRELAVLSHLIHQG